jgi:serine protease Do
MRMVGQGTVFRIDPWGNCATAFHVFEDAFYLCGTTGREMMVRQGRSILALEIEGIVLGAPPRSAARIRSLKLMRRPYSHRDCET